MTKLFILSSPIMRTVSFDARVLLLFCSSDESARGKKYGGNSKSSFHRGALTDIVINALLLITVSLSGAN